MFLPIALASDVLHYLVDGEFEPTLFSSLAEFELYVDRDTRLARAQHPRRNETRFRVNNFWQEDTSFFDAFPIESLLEICSSLLGKISSFIKDRKVTDKGIKRRYKELQRILSSPDDGSTFPHINELWNGTNDSDSDSEDEDTETESESEDTDQDTNRLVKGRRALHVVDLFSSLRQVYDVIEWVDSEDNTTHNHIIKKKYNGTGCPIALQEARHQTMRKDMFPRTQEDWLLKYGELLDPDYPETLKVGPDGYTPACFRPNDTDENVSQQHIESAEARWNAMNQQHMNRLKQEQGDDYNPLFEQGDETSNTAFFSIEDYEKSTVSCSYVV